MGARTVKAVRRFQIAYRLKRTDRLDAGTVRELVEGGVCGE